MPFGTTMYPIMENEKNFQLSANSPASPIRENKNTIWHTVREWAQVIIIALAIAFPIRWFIAEPFIVDGASMDPTFATGQFLIVDRLTYDFKLPQRGDVIVFQYPDPIKTDPIKYYIKRIIGLPGETVVLNNGKVTIINKDNPNGLVLNEPFISAEHYAAYTPATTTLDANNYFVMGDNRAQSSDSRFWGPLESHFIIGRPIARFIPLAIWPGQESQ